MENKKIINASPKDYDGIHFKSLAEVMVYKTLIQQGFSPLYEPQTFVIWEGFVPHKVPFYTGKKFKRKDYRVKKVGNKTSKDERPIDSITYTPDFIFEYNGKTIIVEVKGFENDVFPYKFKMFKKYLEELEDAENYELWEIFTKTQLIECINLLKQ